MMQALERAAGECSVLGVFTRAEEVGFVGAIELAKSGRIPRETTVISLECSSEKGGQCRMGDGAILRVGDRTSIFDPAVTGLIGDLARAAEIPVQPCLMSGGTCEATAYQLYGYRCGALCVALGNYHNCGPEERIEAEFVSLDDVGALVRLRTAMARCEEAPESSLDALKKRLEKRAEEYLEQYGR
jgi:endoglucanase